MFDKEIILGLVAKELEEQLKHFASTRVNYFVYFSVRLAKIIFANLFLLLFINPTTLFGTIYRSHCTISVNFYLYLQYF